MSDCRPAQGHDAAGASGRSRSCTRFFGGLLTVGGAIGALTIGDGLQRSIGDVDGRIAEIDERLESIRSTLVQFRVVQSNGIILGALASGNALRDEYRESFVKLMFVLRRTPAMSLIGELYPADLPNFNKERDELDRLHTAATAPNYTRQSWDDFLTFEMTREARVMDLQSRLLEEEGRPEVAPPGPAGLVRHRDHRRLRRAADRVRDRAPRRPRPPAPDAHAPRRPAAPELR